jgi:signal recognition particle subunit SEC65
MPLSETVHPKAPLSREQFMAVLEGKTTPSEIARKRAARLRRIHLGRLQNEFEASYHNRSTSYLLNALRNLRANLFREQEWRDPDDSELVEMRAAYHAVKKVLATRPHVPNKIEQTTRRRLMAQAQRGQGKAKNR